MIAGRCLSARTAVPRAPRTTPLPPARATTARRRAAPRAAADAVSASSNANAAERLAASLSSAEESEDVMLVADVLAEARVSGVSLPPQSVEAGVRALANGGQFKRAAALFGELPWAAAPQSSSPSSSPPLPDQSTVHALFLAAVQAPLAATEDAAQRADAARAVLDALAGAATAASAAPDDNGGGGGSPSLLDLSPAYNRVLRAYARCPGGGRLDAALALLDEMVSDELVNVDGSTFGCLAAACIDAGRADLAEQVLDARDYL